MEPWDVTVTVRLAAAPFFLNDRIAREEVNVFLDEK